jgi:outer membrane receptor protein involved in Fe transport
VARGTLRLLTLSLALCSPSLGSAADLVSVTGVVRDSSGGAVADATVRLLDSERLAVASATASADGRFQLTAPEGRYVLHVESRGFESYRRRLVLAEGRPPSVDVELSPAAIVEEVTVTATPGVVQSVEDSPQPVNVIGEDVIRERAKAAVAQIALEEPGLNLQRTSPTMAGIYVRGLTGNKVSMFVDGMRYSTGSMRGGVNTFMGLNDPSVLEGVEVLRGPSSAQYGSDAIGGSVQFLSRVPRFSPAGRQVEGAFSTQFNSADLGYGSDLTARVAGTRLSVQGTVTGRRSNTLRTGGGLDSHNAVTRFLGLPSTAVIGDRMPDTAFTTYGGSVKAAWAPSTRDDLVVSYTRGQQDGGKRYDQLLGGDGNLVADLRNLMLDLGYARYTRRALGPLDALTVGYSYNGQREERVNQGGNGNPRAAINHEYERTLVHGVQGQVTRAVGRNAFSAGGDVYFEKVTAPSFSFNPVTGAVAVRRGRVPDGATYQQSGAFLQDVLTLAGGRLDVVASLRLNHISYESRAANSPLVGGRPLWPDDSLDVTHLTWRGGATWRPRGDLTLTASAGTGFRAPHVTDLGTLGLTGAGYEVSFDAIEGRGATVGTTADRLAVSSGLAVEDQLPEKSRQLEGSIRYHGRRVDTDLFAFVNDIEDNITKQTLILPPGAVGSLLGDERITSQLPTGAVFVSLSPSPVLLRANFDDARIWGLEHTLNVRLADSWRLGTVATYLRARDERTDAPPNIEGGTPAPEVWVKLRWAPSGRSWWVEPYARFVARNDRLSTLDLEDRRSGATRSTASIAAFFNNGARARGLVGNGPDGVAGNADDVLIPTGETLAQVQARVLGGQGSSRLVTEIPGYSVFGVRGHIRFAGRHEVFVDLENLGDKNYRGISWGMDAPGRGAYVRYRLAF